MKAQVYKSDGAKGGQIELPASLFEVKWNPDLVHEVVVAMQSNARAGTAHTKDRSEVKATTKKPWRQKGTGRARHGSKVSPIWTGGGVAHGPRNEKDFSKKINKKAKAKAFASTLSRKHADGEVLFVEGITIKAPKTAEAKTIMAAVAKGTGVEELTTKRKNAALIVLADRNDATEKSFSNFGNYEVAQAKDISSVDLLTYKYVVVTDPAVTLETLTARVK